MSLSRLNRNAYPKPTIEGEASDVELVVAKIVDPLIKEGSDLLEEFAEIEVSAKDEAKKQGAIEGNISIHYTNFIHSPQGEKFVNLKQKLEEGYEEFLGKMEALGQSSNFTKEDFISFFVTTIFLRAKGTPYEGLAADFNLKWVNEKKLKQSVLRLDEEGMAQPNVDLSAELVDVFDDKESTGGEEEDIQQTNNKTDFIGAPDGTLNVEDNKEGK